MTVIVSVKINDGIVMASDSASTFTNTQVYEHAEKILNLVKGLPIGVMVTGDGGIGNESLTTLLKDLRKRFGDRQDAMYLDPASYTIDVVAHRLHEFLFKEKSLPAGGTANILLRVCGYSAGRPLPEVWQVQLQGAAPYEVLLVHPEGDFGVNWDGQYDALNRLILGTPTNFDEIAIEWGMSRQDAGRLGAAVRQKSHETLAIPTMPIQDAIDLARYLVEVAIGFTKFSIMKQPKAVGGPIEIAVITKHEGFRWVQSKHFYPPELNN
jgi:20S proteasome alpha/beta subunit